MSCIDPLCMNKILRKSMRCFLCCERKEKKEEEETKTFLGEKMGVILKRRD